MNGQSQIQIVDEFTRKLVVHSAIAGEVILITMDKVELSLMKNRDCLTAKGEWVTPTVLLVTIVTTLGATVFRDFLVSAATWQAVYLVAGAFALVWSCRSIWKAWRGRNRGSIGDILEDLRKQANPIAPPPGPEHGAPA